MRHLKNPIVFTFWYKYCQCICMKNRTIMYKRILTYIFFTLTPLFGISQESHNHAIQYTQNKITTKSYIDLLDQKEVKPCQNKLYHYYNKGKIHSSIGGYTGYLLEGRTETTLENGQLLKSGRFKRGLKVDRWEAWNTNGTLSSIVRWKHGKKQGPFKQFDDHGNLTTIGKYKQDAYHGKIRNYQDGKVVDTQKYRKGVLKEKKKEKKKDKSKGKKNKSSKKDKETKKQQKNKKGKKGKKKSKKKKD